MITNRVIAVIILSVALIAAGIIAWNWTQTTAAPTNSAQTWGGTHTSYDASMRDVTDRIETSFDRAEKRSTIPIGPETIFIGAIISGVIGLGWCGREIRKKPIPAG